MDDCNAATDCHQSRPGGSDSSMDDCNPTSSESTAAGSSVQIPLWTIVTKRMRGSGGRDSGSDSSMDDCNKTSFRLSVTPS